MLTYVLVLWLLTFANAFPRTSMPMQDEDDTPTQHIVLLGQDYQAPHHIHAVMNAVNLHPDHQDVLHVYNNSAFNGFAVNADRQRCATLANLTSVGMLEKDVKIKSAVTSRSPAPWGLERISAGTAGMSELGLNSTYSYNNASLGEGVDLYMLDTGIYTENIDFGGRAAMVWPNASVTDTVGHGTHTAGTAGSDTYGGASRANLLGVQVLPSGGGSMSLLIAGLDFAIRSHSRKKAAGTLVGSVINMSLSTPQGSVSTALDSVVHATTAAGLHVVIAAGNYAADACGNSPAAAGGANSSAIVVGAIGYANAVASFSNTGPCVDLYAPGEQVLSTWINGTAATQYLQGTSMATPHVAGIVAVQAANNATLAQDPAAMKAWIKQSALRGLVGGKVIPSGQLLLLANNGVQVEPAMQLQRAKLAALAVAT